MQETQRIPGHIRQPLHLITTDGLGEAFKVRTGVRLPLTVPQDPELDWFQGGHSIYADH